MSARSFPRRFRPVLALALSLAACGGGEKAPATAPAAAGPDLDELVGVARATVAELAAGDFAAVALRVHPERGVRFSSSAHVDVEADVVLSAAELAAPGSEVRLWGHEDGTGEPIETTLESFVAEVLEPAAFVGAERLSIDHRAGGGNTIDNAAEVFPDATIVELHLGGSERYGGLDWKSLRLAFVSAGGEWRLVGLMRDSWTI